jgi:putative sugar O-methyltransferase
MIDYSAYLRICQQAAENDLVFETFKRHPDYTPILEHVSYEQGLGYIEQIQRNAPVLLNSMDRFVTNDLIGKPHKRYYPGIMQDMSPTTLRYIKVLGDLVLCFGSLNDLDIVEIGGGYGGQCKIIHDIFTPRTYTIVDLPEVLNLNRKYLKDIPNILFRSPDDATATKYDLLISNYAFSEMERSYQEFYKDKIIRYCEKGYMTCNFITSENLTKDEILNLKPNFTVYEERPLTGEGNLIYTWQ